MKKNAQVSSTLVMMIAGVIGLVVILGITGIYGNIFKKYTGKSGCQLEFFVSSVTKQGGKQMLEPECEPHRITITDANLTKQKARANNILDKNRDKYYKTSDTFREYYDYFSPKVNDDIKLKEWAMDETVAKELKYCWDITGQGKLDLFDEWWKLADCKVNRNEKNQRECTAGDITGLNWNSVENVFKNSISFAWPGNWKETKPPTFCVLCTRIKFEQQVKDDFKGKVTSMAKWLANNPISDKAYVDSNVPYAAYLQNEQFRGLFAESYYDYETDDALAVLYERINVFGAKYWASKVSGMVGLSDADEIPQAIQAVKLVKYQEIQNECTYLVG